MKFYVASRYTDQVRVRRYHDKLKELGHSWSSRWATGLHDGMEMLECALDDYDDLKSADCLIFIAHEPRSGRGGRYVEYGLALAWNKLIIVVGTTEEFVFLPLADKILKTEEDFFEELKNNTLYT